MSENIVYFIQANEATAVWSRIKRFLIPPIELTNGRWQPEYVLAALATGEQTLWVVTTKSGTELGAATTQIINYPERRMVAIHYLGGEDFDLWYKDILETLVDYGKRMNCDALECNARLGFWKWFKHDDFKKTSVFYEKKL